MEQLQQMMMDLGEEGVGLKAKARPDPIKMSQFPADMGTDVQAVLAQIQAQFLSLAKENAAIVGLESAAQQGRVEAEV
jgi:hypothetical protein